MRAKLIVIRRILIALVSAFVAYRLGIYLSAKGFENFELVDYMVILPMFVMAILLIGVCLKALLRHTASSG